ncbi:helix-turn-helix transcriptional regulator [Lysobacter enzymogenes]|uniref:Transcriptional regulator n=1 Tax=Lysobacter enzymogenes TaxID=69 RepID=A0AAU9AIR0_LYSEN|nr:MarR family transcriptional regulator [Lysobacter enzymogenes]BAV98012.1 transcriptional regulator [Lysobacter enzymogenes]
MSFSKDQILGLLLRGSMTVAELGQRLGVTRNAVNVQLKQLEAEGLVRRVAPSGARGVGKPALVYEAAPGAEDRGSRAYPIALSALIATLRSQLSPQQLEAALQEAGRRMAREAGLRPSANPAADLAAAMAAADSLGASTEATAQGSTIEVVNYSCPIAGAVRADSCACKLLSAFFSEATGRPVDDRCHRQDRLICRYVIRNDDDTA